MAAKEFESTKWKHLKTALYELEDGLRCGLCKKVASDPLSYHCGHFYCDGCACPSESLCPICKVPSQASEILPDRIISDVIGCFRTLSSIVTADRLERAGDPCNGGTDTSNKEAVCGSNESTRHRNNEQTAALKPNDHVKSGIHSSKQGARKSISNLKTDEDVKGPSQNRSEIKTTEALPTESIPDKDTFLKPTRGRKVLTRGKGSTKIANNKAETSSADSNVQGNSSLLNKEDDIVQKRTARSQCGRSSSIDSSKSYTLDKIDLQSEDERIRDEFTTPRKPRPRGRPPKQKTNELNQSAFKFTPSRKNNTPGKEIIKRNHKGETPLHVACIKGNIERIRSLLEAKASPNTKDNAGWTPLHEASIHGFTDVVELLLKTGALVDVPGAGNVTPLHEAVINNHTSVVKLLVSHGAKVHARSSEGKTPIELAKSDEMKDALLNTKITSEPNEVDLSILKPSAPEQEMVLCGAPGLTPEEEQQLLSVASSMNVKLVHSFGPDVTHLIVPSNERSACPPSVEVLAAILKGIHILTRDWLKMGGDIQNEEIFESTGITDFQDADAPKLSRMNAQKQLPGLFNGCHFFVTSNVHYNLSSCALSKTDIVTLIRTGGGVVLKRQPDPEAIPVSEQTVPYHAPQSGALTATSHFILYSPGKGEPVLKYNMKHCKTLPVEWFITCVLNWQLLDP